MDLFIRVILNLIVYFLIAIGENSGRMRNEAVVLSSVYDAMRNNLVSDSAAINSAAFRNNLINYELRNKRNINEKWDYEKGLQDEPYLTPQQQFLKGERWKFSLNFNKI